MKLFSTKIKELRKENKKTQQNIADLLNIRRSTYGEYERGKILPPMDKVKVLAEYFNVSVDYLIGSKNESEVELPEELVDISAQLKTALKQLKETKKELMFDGKPMDKESRQILVQSLENGLKMAQIIIKGKEQ